MFWGMGRGFLFGGRVLGGFMFGKSGGNDGGVRGGGDVYVFGSFG